MSDIPLGKDLVLDVRVRLHRDNFLLYGKGVSQLLRLCGQHHSLHMAAKTMGMSYRKALRLVARAEDGFGTTILDKSIGGAGGGGSRLTPFGQRLVDDFSRFEEEVEECARQSWQRHFPETVLAPPALEQDTKTDDSK